MSERGELVLAIHTPKCQRRHDIRWANRSRNQTLPPPGPNRENALGLGRAPQALRASRGLAGAEPACRRGAADTLARSVAASRRARPRIRRNDVRPRPSRRSISAETMGSWGRARRVRNCPCRVGERCRARARVAAGRAIHSVDAWLDKVFSSLLHYFQLPLPSPLLRSPITILIRSPES